MKLSIIDRNGHSYDVDCGSLTAIDGMPFAPSAPSAPSAPPGHDLRPEANIEGRLALLERNTLLILSVLNISPQGDAHDGH